MNASNVKCNELFLNPQIEYQIEFFAEGSRESTLKGTFLAVQSDKKHVAKKRTQNTTWAYVHKLGNGFKQVNIKWKFMPQSQDNEYKIIVAEGQFAGHELQCFEDSKMDFRDKVPSIYAFVCPPGYIKKFNKWKVEKWANNIFWIKNTDNNLYLTSHRYYGDKDARDNNSTYAIGFPHEDGATYWKIKPF